MVDDVGLVRRDTGCRFVEQQDPRPQRQRDGDFEQPLLTVRELGDAALGRLSADIAILIIEHDMDVVFRFAHEIVVLVQGRVLMRGMPETVSADPRVRAVYLGKTAR